MINNINGPVSVALTLLVQCLDPLSLGHVDRVENIVLEVVVKMLTLILDIAHLDQIASLTKTGVDIM